jgi:hypothetical protein
MGQRWAFDQAVVEVGKNKLTVRELSDAERAKFATCGKDTEYSKLDLLSLLVSLAAVDPPLTQDEARTMPSRLLDAAAARIMELSGLNEDEKKA